MFIPAVFSRLGAKICLRSALAFGILGLSNPSYASMVANQSLEKLVESCGVNSVWGSECEVKQVEPGMHSLGFKVVTLSLECEILKSPPAGFMHPIFGEWIKPGGGRQAFKVQMIDLGQYPQWNSIAGIPAVGTHGTMGFTGPSAATGLSGFCGTTKNGLFLESQENGERVLKNMGESQKQERKARNSNAKNMGATSEAKNHTGIPAAKDELNQKLKQLLKQSMPPAETKPENKTESSEPSGLEISNKPPSNSNKHNESPDTDSETDNEEPRSEEPTP